MHLYSLYCRYHLWKPHKVGEVEFCFLHDIDHEMKLVWLYYCHKPSWVNTRVIYILLFLQMETDYQYHSIGHLNQLIPVGTSFWAGKCLSISTIQTHHLMHLHQVFGFVLETNWVKFDLKVIGISIVLYAPPL